MQNDNRGLIRGIFYLNFVHGVYTILIGSVFPAIQKEYQLDYQVGGWLLSAVSIGILIVSMLIGLCAKRFGMKQSVMVFGHLVYVGFFLLAITANPICLFVGMILIGASRGATSVFAGQMVTVLTKGSGSALNLLQAFFAVGAVVSPLIVLLCDNWRLSFLVVFGLGVIGFVVLTKMRIVQQDGTTQAGKEAGSFGFFREKRFWFGVILLTAYLAIESSVMGWMATFFVDSGVTQGQMSQLLATMLWGALLAGRLLCSVLARKYKPYQLLSVMTVGVFLFLFGLIFSHGFWTMVWGTIGLGMSLAGMYGTITADYGELFERYFLCLGFFTMIPSMGSLLAPSVVGAIANQYGIRAGFGALLVPGAIVAGMSIWRVLQERHVAPFKNNEQ